MDDTTEVERLRARIIQLEAQQKAAEGTPVRSKQDRTSAWWAAASAVLIILACSLAPLSVASDSCVRAATWPHPALVNRLTARVRVPARGGRPHGGSRRPAWRRST